MTGIFVKTGFKCTSCEGFIPLNALVHEITCPACGHQFDLTEENWSTILEDTIEEVPYIGEGEGRGHTIFSQFNIKLEAGRLQPRYNGTKDSIPTEEIIAALERVTWNTPKQEPGPLCENTPESA